jgi:uncharacterized protein YlxW (UPF0749 family)
MSAERDKVAERAKIEAALKNHDGNIEKAAQDLGSSRRTLQNRMREYGMPRGTSGRRKERLPYSRLKDSSGALGIVGAVAAVVGAGLLVNKYRRKPV